MKIFHLNKYLKENILLIIGILIIAYIFFVRVILKRLPREINLELPFLTKIVFAELFILFLALFITNIVTVLKSLGYYNPRKNIIQEFLKNKLGNKIRTFLNIWTESLLAVHKSLVNKIPYFTYCLKISSMFLLNNIKFYNNKYFIYLLDFLPKSIVLCCFLYDVFSLQTFKYFYKFSVLLLVPLLFSYFIYAVRQYCLDNIEDFNNYIEISDIATGKSITSLEYFALRGISGHDFDLSQHQFTFTANFEEQHKDNTTIDWEATLNQFMQKFSANFCEVGIFFMRLSSWREFYLPIFNVILYFFYIIGWAHVLFLIFTL